MTPTTTLSGGFGHRRDAIAGDSKDRAPRPNP